MPVDPRWAGGFVVAVTVLNVPIPDWPDWNGPGDGESKPSEFLTNASDAWLVVWGDHVFHTAASRRYLKCFGSFFKWEASANHAGEVEFQERFKRLTKGITSSKRSAHGDLFVVEIVEIDRKSCALW